jgi:hypothetical protein
MSPADWIAARREWRRELRAMLPPTPNCRCFLPPQETTMIPVKCIGRRERDGRLFAIVNTKDVSANVEHSFLFSGRSDNLLVRPYSFLDGDTGEDLPKGIGEENGPLTWVRLDDICPVKVLHVTEYEGHIACVVDSLTVPRGVCRSRARWIPLQAFINEVHPATAKDSLTQGPTDGPFGTGYCWLFLDALFTDYPEADVKAPLTAPVSCGYKAPKPDLIDGLTRAQCFERYERAMQHEHLREEGSGHRGAVLNIKVGDLALTPLQWAVAQQEWKSRLNAKVEETHYAEQAADAAVVGWDPYGDD